MSHPIRVPPSTSTSSSSSSVSSPHLPRCHSTSTSTSTHSDKATSLSKNQNREASQPHDIFTITDEVLAAQYNFESEIGYGNWGTIWRISPKNPSNRLHSSSKLAVKLVHRDKSSNTTATKIKSLWSEFKILRQFKNAPHSNVLRVSSFIITPSYALLTMAFHPAILPVRLGERSPKVRKYMRGLLAGTEFLHQHRVSHNDLKPANIVLSADDEPVLIDFGFAVAYGPDYSENTGKPPFLSTLSWGTPEYLSPQRAKAEEHDERLSDIWSLGVTLYEIVVGRTPFEMNEKEEFLSKEALEVYYQRTLKGEFLGPHTLSTELRQLLISMLRPDPTARLQSCAIALMHPFFRRPSETSFHRRTPSSNLRDSSGRTIELANRRMHQLTIQSPSGPKLKVADKSPNHKHSAFKNKTPTKNEPKTNLHQDLHSTPQSISRNNRITPTRPVLALKSVNTPTTPQQRVAAPRFHLDRTPSIKPVISSPKPTSAARVLASSKPGSTLKEVSPSGSPRRKSGFPSRVGYRQNTKEKENLDKPH